MTFPINLQLRDAFSPRRNLYECTLLMINVPSCRLVCTVSSAGTQYLFARQMSHKTSEVYCVLTSSRATITPQLQILYFKSPNDKCRIFPVTNHHITIIRITLSLQFLRRKPSAPCRNRSNYVFCCEFRIDSG